MILQQFQEEIERLGIVDARVVEITNTFYGDELLLRLSVVPGKPLISLSFSGCYSINMQHCWSYPKPCSWEDYSSSRSPYFVHGIRPSCVDKAGVTYYHLILDIFPLEVTVVCKDLAIKSTADELLFSTVCEPIRV